MRWSRGVDTELFRPRRAPASAAAGLSLRRPRRGGEEHRGLPRPRPARQQGGGRRRPAAAELRGYPEVLFAGPMTARSWRAPMPPPTSSCFRASPTPSASCCSRRWRAAFRWRLFRCRAAGRDHRPMLGRHGSDLRAAMAKALELDRRGARAHALRFSWENSARQFIENVLAAHQSGGLPAKPGTLSALAREARRTNKTARLGGNRAVSFSCAQFGGRFGGNRVLPEMVSKPLKFKNPPAKSCAEAAKSRNYFAKKILRPTADCRGFRALIAEWRGGPPPGEVLELRAVFRTAGAPALSQSGYGNVAILGVVRNSQRRRCPKWTEPSATRTRRP